MSKKQATPSQPIAGAPNLFSADIGNGGVKIATSDLREVISFAPVMAPVTTRRGLAREDEKPRHSLRINNSLWVFGLRDCITHGRRSGWRRLNAKDRYISLDYKALFEAALIAGFAAWRGNSDYLRPTGVLSVPIEIYNDADTVDRIKGLLCGARTLEDYGGCQLRVDMQANRLRVLPESAGIMWHTVYDPVSLQPRHDVFEGATLVVDIGYWSTDCSIFDGLTYRRSEGASIMAGMSGVVRRVQEAIAAQIGNVDISEVDHALRPIAGKAAQAHKEIEISGVMADVTAIYDEEVEGQAARIADEVRSLYQSAIARIILGGGAALHLGRAIKARIGKDVLIAPDPEFANVLGGLTMLRQKIASLKP